MSLWLKKRDVAAGRYLFYFMALYYPLFINLKDENCVVVGGGKVAERKVLSLLQYGAKVVLIAPEITQKLAELASENCFVWRQKEYDKDDLKGAMLVFCATNNRDVNFEVSEHAKKNNILVNIVDIPELCNFIVPANLHRGNLTISVSTDGKSPSLAVIIRDELKELYKEEYTDLLELMGELRPLFIEKVKGSYARKEILKEALNDGILDLIRQGKNDEAKNMLVNLFCENKHGEFCDDE